MARKCKYSHSSFICLIVSCAAVDIALLLTQLKAGIATALNIDKTAITIASSIPEYPLLCISLDTILFNYILESLLARNVEQDYFLVYSKNYYCQPM